MRPARDLLRSRRSRRSRVLAVPAHRAAPRPHRARSASALAHLALVASLWMVPGAPRRWAAGSPSTRSGCIVLTLVERALPRRSRIYAVGYLRRSAPARRPRVREPACSAFLAAASLVVAQPPPRAAVDRHGDDDARRRAAHLPPARPPLARGGVEVPACCRRSASRSRCSATFFLATRAARVAGGGRWSCEDLIAHARAAAPGVAARGVRVPAHRLRHEDGTRARCTRGSRTPTARRRASSAGSWPARSRAARSSGSRA